MATIWIFGVSGRGSTGEAPERKFRELHGNTIREEMLITIEI
jgi:hypothetical protein